MRKLILVALSFIVLVVVGLLVAPFFIPASAYKGHIEQQASQSLGREVTIGDELSLSLFPSAKFKVSDLKIANPDGMSAPFFATMEEAAVGVKTLPLFSRRVEIDEFVLIRPDIHLERNAAGEANWELRAPPSAPQEGQAPGDESVSDLRLGDVRLNDGRVRYIDAQAGMDYAAEDINVVLSLSSLADPFTIRGDLVFEGRPVAMDVRIDSLADISGGEAAELQANLTLDDARLRLDATTNAGAEAFSYRGALNVDIPSVRTLMEWLDPEAELPEKGFGPLQISGDVSGGAALVRFAEAKFRFDEIEGRGNVAFDLSGARPKASGDIGVATLDLRPYAPPASEEAAEIPPWSSDPIDFSALQSVDADFSIEADAILLQNLSVGESALRAVIENGSLTADLTRMTLYGGTGVGRVNVDATGGAAAITASMNLEGIDAQPLLVDAIAFERLVGAGALSFEARMRGRSQADFMRTLNGGGGFNLRDGAIAGVDLAKAARALDAIIPALTNEQSEDAGAEPAEPKPTLAEALSVSEQTDFAEFGASFRVSDGIVSTNDIRLLSPFLRLSGGGAIDLPRQSVDLRLEPRLVSSREGAGGALDAAGYKAPLKVTGTFNAPSIALDAESVAKNAVENVVTDQLQRLFGGEESDASTDGDARNDDGVAAELGKSLIGSFFGSNQQDEPQDNQ